MPQNSTNPLHRVMNWKLAIIKERSFGKSLKRKRTLLISDKLATRDFPELSSRRLVKPKNNGRSFNDRSITYSLWAALAMVWVVAVREQSLVPNLCQSWVCNLEQSTMTVDLLVVHYEHLCFKTLWPFISFLTGIWPNDTSTNRTSDTASLFPAVSLECVYSMCDWFLNFEVYTCIWNPSPVAARITTPPVIAISPHWHESLQGTIWKLNIVRI